MSHDEFTLLFKFMSEKFSAIDDRFDAMSQRFDSLSNLVDSYAKKSETYHQEMLVLNHRVDRSEKWIFSAADKVGVKLITH